MNRSRIILDPVLPTELEVEAIASLSQALAANIDSSQKLTVKLVEVGGKSYSIPEPLYQVLHQATQIMAAGKAVSLMPIDVDMTIEEAANLLKVSKPYLVQLLEDGVIPYRQIGSEWLMRLEDVMDYKKQWHRQRRELLKELAEFSQEEELHEPRVYN